MFNHGYKNFSRATVRWDDSNRGSELKTPKLGSSLDLISKAPAPGRAAGSQDTARIHNFTEEFQDSGYQGRLIQGDSILRVLFIAANCGAFLYYFLFRASKICLGVALECSCSFSSPAKVVLSLHSHSCSFAVVLLPCSPHFSQPCCHPWEHIDGQEQRLVCIWGLL